MGSMFEADNDIMMGRFARPAPVEPSTQSSASHFLSEFEPALQAIETALSPVLEIGMTSRNDRALLIQCMIADGMDSQACANVLLFNRLADDRINSQFYKSDE